MHSRSSSPTSTIVSTSTAGAGTVDDRWDAAIATSFSRSPNPPENSDQYEQSDPPPAYVGGTSNGRHARNPPIYSVTNPRPRAPVTNASSTSIPVARAKPNPPLGSLPTAGQCLAHLRLLECFNQLREEIGTTDGVFGLRDEFVSPGLGEKTRNEILAKLCEKRWQVYVTRASLRFQTWWRSLEPMSKMLVEDALQDESYRGIATSARPIIFTIDNLPPIDVLMVYHAFMLNPRSFFSDCIRFGKMGVWASGMPWDAISSAIDKQEPFYRPSEQSRLLFKQRTGHPWDNLDEPPKMKMKCFGCEEIIAVPWTTTDSKQTWASDEPGEDGLGFADKNFCYDSSCGLRTTHEVARVQRLKRDVRSLFVERTPMPGTFLTTAGLPATALKNIPGAGTYAMTFPNRLLKAGLGKTIAQLCSTRRTKHASMQDVLDKIVASFGDEALLRKTAGVKAGPRKATSQERLAVRNMMAAYWDNTSMFSLDVVGAVIRQNNFTTKMVDIDWLHSVAMGSTMERLISKYDRFFTIMARYPENTVVPTLDIDLAWHTHQLSPPLYLGYSLKKTEVFIDHDDKIDENALSTAFEWTSKVYQTIFQSVYSECTCWYCEAIREAHGSPEAPLPPNKLSRLFKSTTAPLDPLADSIASLHLDPTPPPMNNTPGPHISSHNATRAAYEDPDIYLSALVASRRLDRAYENACRRAKKAGRPLPVRDEGVAAWGYAFAAREGYAPFMSDPCVRQGLYVSPPACAGGMQGSCAQMVMDAGGKGGKGIAVGACGGGGGGGS